MGSRVRKAAQQSVERCIPFCDALHLPMTLYRKWNRQQIQFTLFVATRDGERDFSDRVNTISVFPFFRFLFDFMSI